MRAEQWLALGRSGLVVSRTSAREYAADLTATAARLRGLLTRDGNRRRRFIPAWEAIATRWEEPMDDRERRLAAIPHERPPYPGKTEEAAPH